MAFGMAHRTRGVRHKVSSFFPNRRFHATEKEKHLPSHHSSSRKSSKEANPSTTVENQSKQDGEYVVVPIDFVTLGMFIIDDIDFLPPSPPVKNILGGAGTYSALGARLFSPAPQSTAVGWIVDQGSDFPDHLATLISSWETSVLMRVDKTRKTTRAWNGYEGTDEKRAFKYTTPKKRLTAEDMTPDFLLAKCFHLICSPLRCQELVIDIKKRRKAILDPDSPVYSRPIFIWEPVPDLCTPDELINLTNTLPLVDILSPNHSELAGFMADDGLDPETGEISTKAIERACEQLLGSMPLSSFTIVVRAGEKGCYITKNGGRKKRKGKDNSSSKRRKKDFTPGMGLQPDTDMEALFAGLLQEDGEVAQEEVEIEVDPGIERWLPAYHTDPTKVVDPTGGGNTFLGGLGVALGRGEGVEEAAVWASVAASFAIEQVGVPMLGRKPASMVVVDQGGEGELAPDQQQAKTREMEQELQAETWNGVIVLDRLEEFRRRITKFEEVATT